MWRFFMFKITTKYLILFLFFVLSLSLIQPIKNANANMFNRFKKGFYFEKYSNAQEAKAELLKLHPIGSDVGELVKRLEGAGCDISEVSKNKLDEAKKTNPQKYSRIDKIINCANSTGFMNWLVWRVSVIVINEKIDDIGISKEYTGL